MKVTNYESDFFSDLSLFLFRDLRFFEFDFERDCLCPWFENVFHTSRNINSLDKGENESEISKRDRLLDLGVPKVWLGKLW